MERIINNKFLEFIEIIKNDFKNEKCFNAGGYLGSMLYFDFGNQISKKSILQKEKTIILGSKKIGIRDCYWEIIRCDCTLINSDDIDVYSFNFSIFNLQSLIDIKFDNKIFKILLPITFPKTISPLPDINDFILTANSGALVPKATIVSPINILDTLKLPATALAPSTKISAPLIKIIKPTIKNTKFNIIIPPYSYFSN